MATLDTILAQVQSQGTQLDAVVTAVAALKANQQNQAAVDAVAAAVAANDTKIAAALVP